MSLIFAAFWKIYEPIAACLAPILLALLIGLWVADRTHIASLNHDNDKLRAQIDDPNTGFRAQISNLNNSLATARENQKQMTASILQLNASIDALHAASDLAAQRARAAQAQAAASEARAQGVAARLAAQRPQTGSYADLVGLIRRAN